MRHPLALRALLLLVFATPTLLSAQNLAKKQNPTGELDHPKLAERTLLDGKISMLVPEDFTVMSEDLMKTKYPNENRPTLVLTNPRGTVNVALNHTQNNLLPSQIGEIHEAMEGMFKNLYPSASWNRSEVMTIQGREFFTLDLRTPAVDTEIRNIMAGTSVDGRLLLVTFNCTKELEGEWAETGQRIMESIVATVP